MTPAVPGFDFATLGVILFVACVVAMITRRFDLPYSVGLVAAGAALSLLPGEGPPLTRDLIFFVLLPPLVFEAAIQIPWKPFRRELPLLLALVTVGVVLAAAVVAGGMHWLAGWSWIGAALFGVLIAATDPVAVIATFKEIAVDKRLHLLVEAESLLNDGVAAVLFAVMLTVAGGAAAGGGLGPAALSFDLVKTIVGGLLAGGLVAGGLLLVAWRTHDRLVELTLSTLAAYASFLLAEHFHCSGVLATLTAGIIVGNVGAMGMLTARGRQALLNFWEFAAFLANSFVFILIGQKLAKQPLWLALGAAALAILLSLAGRAMTVYAIAPLFARSRLRLPLGFQHVLFWGGLRGALALALALGLPVDLPEHDAIITVSFAVVAVSILVQGLTMPGLVRRLGLLRSHEEAAFDPLQPAYVAGTPDTPLRPD